MWPFHGHRWDYSQAGLFRKCHSCKKFQYEDDDCIGYYVNMKEKDLHVGSAGRPEFAPERLFSLLVKLKVCNPWNDHFQNIEKL